MHAYSKKLSGELSEFSAKLPEIFLARFNQYKRKASIDLKTNQFD